MRILYRSALAGRSVARCVTVTPVSRLIIRLLPGQSRLRDSRDRCDTRATGTGTGAGGQAVTVGGVAGDLRVGEHPGAGLADGGRVGAGALGDLRRGTARMFAQVAGDGGAGAAAGVFLDRAVEHPPRSPVGVERQGV